MKYAEECKPVTRQVCEKVHYAPVCRDVITQECSQVPKEECRQVPRPSAKEVRSRYQPSYIPTSYPYQVCVPVAVSKPRQECRQVPRQECSDISKTQCTFVPTEITRTVNEKQCTVRKTGFRIKS